MFPDSLISQWPGYPHWKRQVAAKDETSRRAPITIGRFMKHLASSVDKFFNVRPSLLQLSPSLINFLAL